MKRKLHVSMAVGQGQINKLIQQKNKRAGLLPGQSKVLEYISENDGCSQKDICDAWNLDRSTVSGLITRMKRDGLISIHEAEHDRRKKVISLTESGMDKWKIMRSFIGDIDKRAFAGISAKEQAELFDTLDRIHENIDKITT